MCQIRESTKVTLKDDILLPLGIQVLCAIAYLTAMTAWSIDVADEQCIICAVVLDDAGTFEQSAFIGLTLEIMALTAFDHTLQVTRQLTHLPSSVEDIGRAVVVKE